MENPEKTEMFNMIDFLKELVGGFSLSGIGAIIVPEALHLIFVIIGGAAGTIVVHLVRRWVHKKWPLDDDK